MIGTDIVEVSRIETAINAYGKVYLDKLFTPDEQAYANAYRYPAERYAARFAVKEAVAKLIQTGPPNYYLDIEVYHNQHGAPEIRLSQRLQKLVKGTLHVSISHEREYALAVVFLHI